ncbi:MAG: hypothetical protein GF404_07330 [candidate division Zixibacteria bacterium]|nr:hypothetical protein [candidate division Zixibacteria bacterium]
MIRRVLLSLIVAAFLTATLYAGSSPNTRKNNKAGAKTSPVSKYRGKFKLMEDQFDFGYMPPRSKASHKFWIKNEGTDTLEIVKVSPG